MQTRPRATDTWLILGLLALGVGLPAIVSALAGTLEIPRNDDWSYRRLAIALANTGQFKLDGAASTMVVGQLVIVQPFLWLSQLQPWAFAAAGIAFASTAIAATYALARQILPTGRAAIVGLLLVGFPGYLAYATSFMTDVPTLACEFICLALGAKALRSRPVPTPWLLASLAFGCVGFTIRDFALAAPAAVAFAAICAEPRRARHWAVAVAIAVGFVVLYLWRSSLSGVINEARFQEGSGLRIIPALSSVAFFVSPAAVLAWRRWRGRLRRTDLIVGAEIGLAIIAAPIVIVILNRTVPTTLLQNLTTQWGSPGPEFLMGGRPLLFSDAVWTVINLVAMVAVVVVTSVGAGIVGSLVRRWRTRVRDAIAQVGSPVGLLLVFTLAVGGGLLLYGLLYHVYDRYLWAIVVPLAALLLHGPGDLRAVDAPPRGRDRPVLRVTAVAAFSGTLALMSGLLLLNSHAFDAARWRAGERLVELGVAPGEIDAGYEWVGYHASVAANAERPVRGLTWYEGWWSSFRPCGLVSAVPLDDPLARPVGTSEWRLNLIAGPDETLYLYRRAGPGCAPG